MLVLTVTDPATDPLKWNWALLCTFAAIEPPSSASTPALCNKAPFHVLAPVIVHEPPATISVPLPLIAPG